jgi:hypothetical protein
MQAIGPCEHNYHLCLCKKYLCYLNVLLYLTFKSDKNDRSHEFGAIEKKMASISLCQGESLASQLLICYREEQKKTNR